MPDRPLVPETFAVKLISARPLGPRVRHLVFERSGGAPFDFEPGQWVQLIFPMLDEKGKPVRRAYSIASPPGGTRFELAITKVDEGVGSRFLHDAQPGLELEVKGPMGTFTRAADGGALFIATGSGIAPFRSMLLDAIAKGRREPLWVLFGVRSPDELLYGDELEALARSHPGLVRLEPTFSRPPSSWSGRTGYVQTHVAELWKALVDTHPDAHAYVCGVRKMLLATKDVLRDELSVDRKRVHLEAYD